MSRLDEIRAACATVAANSTHVSIDHERLADFVRDFAVEALTRASDDLGRVRHGDDEATAAFVIALDTVNFGSGYFPFLAKRPGLSGYHTVAAALRDHAAANGPILAADLATLDPPRCAEIFGQRLDGGFQQELMGYFATALNDLGHLVAGEYAGSFLDLVADADRSAERLLRILDRLAYFHDVHTWRGTEVPLYKRAQITAYDLAVAFDHEGPGRFDDLDRLTMFADNLVPHVLRVEGVLRFSDDLVARIDAVEDIASGSEPEVEIRACGVHAVELIVAGLAGRGVATTAGVVDGVLWEQGAADRYKSVPRHRTRCVFY